MMMDDQDIYQDNKTTVCTTYWWDGTRRELVGFTGIANRCPEDKFDRRIGEQLALSRSLKKAAAYFERQANGRVKHADWKRQQRLQRAMKDPDGSLAKHLTAIHAPPVSDDPVFAPNGVLAAPGGHIEAMSLTEWEAMADERVLAYEEDNTRGDR